MDSDLLDQIDADSEVREKGRSAFIGSAVQIYLKAKERREIEAQLVQAYSGEADSLLEEVEALMGSANMAERLNRGEIWLLDLASSRQAAPGPGP